MTESSIGCSVYHHSTCIVSTTPDASYTMTWRMMQWFLATIFVILCPAELRVSRQSTKGQQSASAAVSGFAGGALVRPFQQVVTWVATTGIY